MFTNPEAWSRFLQTLVCRARARIDVTVSLKQDGQVAGRFHGRFVALDVGRG